MMRQLRSAPSVVIVHFAMTVPLTPATSASRGGTSSDPETSTGRVISGPNGRMAGAPAGAASDVGCDSASTAAGFAAPPPAGEGAATGGIVAAAGEATVPPIASTGGVLPGCGAGATAPETPGVPPFCAAP